MAANWTQEQIDEAKAFFDTNPDADTIYETAKQLDLNPEQLSSIYSTATGQDFNQVMSGVNEYLSTTNKTLGTGETFKDYYTPATSADTTPAVTTPTSTTPAATTPAATTPAATTPAATTPTFVDVTTPYGSYTADELANVREFFDQPGLTGDQIYAAANEIGLSAEQLADLYAQTGKGTFDSALNSINEYLTERGRTLTGGYQAPEKEVPEAPEAPKATLTSAFIPQQDQTQATQTMQNIAVSPETYIPTSAKQTYTPQEVQAGELMTGTEMAPLTPVTAPAAVTTPTLSTVPNMTADEVAQIEQIAAASYQAAMSGIAPEVTAATAAGPSNLITAAQGEITNLAQAAQGTLPVSALMSNQVEELLKVADGQSVPNWALPALRAAENALAARGMGRSSVAREALMSSIVNAALPIAQANATAIQQDYLANLSNRQQAAITNANNLAQMDLANLNANQQAQVENAKAFLAIDLANLTNTQQAGVINAQIRQQQMLSDQAATNAALQFNAANEQQTAQFMANLNSTIELNNAARNDAASQYNSQLAQQRAALDAGNELAVAQFNAQMQQQVNQFNAQLDFNRSQFNTQNAIAIEQSNVTWRRQLNTQNTAGINAVNQANAMNAFNLSNQALTFLWQQTRDEASWAFQAGQNAQDQQTRLAIAALGNEAAKDTTTATALIEAGKLAWTTFSPKFD